MRLNHPNYLKLLRAAYNKIATTGEKPLLTKPTRTGIRRECMNVYAAGIEKRDEPILRAFFGTPKSGEDYKRMIERMEADRFRPLQNYLKGETENTDATNVELLAWLIDFKHRPYRLDSMVILTDEEKLILGDERIMQNEEREERIVLEKMMQNEERVNSFYEPETKACRWAFLRKPLFYNGRRSSTYIGSLQFWITHTDFR